MVTRYGKGRGKSGSKRPEGKTSYSWLTYKPKEVEMLIVKLAKEGKSSSQIGLVLRDSYGIPDVRVVLKKKITQVLKEKKVESELPEDLLALIRRDVALRKHFESNKQDKTAKRGIEITESKIKRLIKYYKGTGKIEETWKYDPSKAGMYVE